MIESQLKSQSTPIYLNTISNGQNIKMLIKFITIIVKSKISVISNCKKLQWINTKNGHCFTILEYYTVEKTYKLY